MRLLAAFLGCICYMPAVFAQEALEYQRPPEPVAGLAEAPPTPAVRFSPDKELMAVLERSARPPIEELAKPELRLGGLRINPANNGPSRVSYYTGLQLRTIKDSSMTAVNGLPEPLQMTGFSFSPGGGRAAFLQHEANRIELWMIDLETRQARKASERKVNAVMGGYSWLADAGLIFTSVPEDRPGPEERPDIPAGPVVEENLGSRAPSRTYQDLLEDRYDEQAFTYYTTSRLIRLDAGGTEQAIGEPGIYATVDPSPDGEWILAKEVHPPFSYLVPWYRFPQKVAVLDLQGNLVKELIDIPLQENIPIGFNAVQKEPRRHAWRADQPATLYWVEALDEGDPKQEADLRDKLVEWACPFEDQPRTLAELPLRFSGVTWGNAETAWVRESWRADRKIRTYQLSPSDPDAGMVTVFDRSYEDVYNDPGSVVTVPGQYARPVMAISSEREVYLSGDGASPEGDMPFLDKYDLATGKTTRIWQCEAPYYEQFVTFIDPEKEVFVTSRESIEENPDYYLREGGAETLTALTRFPHPYPQLEGVSKETLHYEREDGVDLTATLYLPAGYQKQDGPLPGFVWAYPREYKSRDAAGQVRGSKYAFTRIPWGSAVYWVTQGYAILDNAAFPIVGEGGQEPNDTFVEQLEANARAVIDHAASIGVLDTARVAVGGHSYGAFMTANLLAHTNLFKAGIARSGAYNRTFTPFGFQAEERTYWEAPEIYYRMSPFSYAHQIKTPILLLHGDADNNSGTFPIQSARLYNAIKGHGGTARYVVLPYESHGYSARESVLHTLWEMDQWLDKYVKGEDPYSVSEEETADR